MRKNNYPLIDKFFILISDLWEKVKDLGVILKLCRFSVIMILLVLLFLTLSPAGQDQLRGLAELRGTWTYVIGKPMVFFFSLIFWAGNAWYWARIMLSFHFDEPEVLEPDRKFRQNTLRKHMPRLLGVVAFAVVGIAFYNASRVYNETSEKGAANILIVYAIICVVLAIVFYGLTAVRRKVSQAIYKRFKDAPLVQKTRLKSVVAMLEMDTNEQAYAVRLATYRELKPVSLIIYALSMSLSIVLFFLFLFKPDTASSIGAATIVMLAAANWIPVGSTFVYWGNVYKVPVIVFMLTALCLFSLWNDNHATRSIIGENAPQLSSKKSVQENFPAWLKDRLERWPTKEEHPVFVIAAEGGGIRAAYWTGMVLAAIQDENPWFADHIYALSGVSGGSLGETTFVALVREQINSNLSNCKDDPITKGSDGRSLEPMQKCAHAVLSADFLAPTVAYMLYPDLLQRFLFFKIPRFDRARALECSWEKSWSDNIGNNCFSKGFHTLWQGYENRLPALLLNSTHVESGKRVLVSNLKVDNKTSSDTDDFYEITKTDSPLSTAIHNSARFTYVSPAGTLIQPNGKVWGHLVDGGYFENSGGSTALEILTTMKNSVAEQEWKKIKPVVILITNDPKKKNNIPINFMNETFSPVVTMLNTRNARGSYSRATLQNWVRNENGKFITFDLHEGHGPLPLSWFLSDAAIQAMLEQLKDLKFDLSNLLKPR